MVGACWVRAHTHRTPVHISKCAGWHARARGCAIGGGSRFVGARVLAEFLRVRGRPESFHERGRAPSMLPEVLQRRGAAPHAGGPVRDRGGWASRRRLLRADRQPNVTAESTGGQQAGHLSSAVIEPEKVAGHFKTIPLKKSVWTAQESPQNGVCPCVLARAEPNGPHTYLTSL
jgi:hypothetical protein